MATSRFPGNRMWKVFRRLVLAAPLLAAPFAAARGESITVVMDDNYPPYVFRTPDGNLQGILPELWDLWSKRSGFQVRLEATDWSEAKRRFNAGEADVIDTIFRTPEREKIYEFSAPYATIAVPIFFSAELSGINDARTLRGFTVGVKNGDACIDYLLEQGISAFQRYSSYEALISAAGAGEVKTMCVDQPPATYFLIKKGLDTRFRATPPLYSGQFHWAVMKGRADLSTTIERGFARISASERSAIERRWMGRTVGLLADEETLQTLRTVALVVVLAGLLLTVWVWLLRRQVAARTRELSHAMAELAQSERRFRTIFNNINDAIFIHNAASGAIIMVNRRAEEMYGWPAAEFPALSLQDLSEGRPPYNLDTALERIGRSAAEPQVFEWRARHRDGHLFWVEVALRRAVIDSGEERLLVVVRDINDRMDAEENLTRIIEALTRSNADLESFAYAASHDLREPLTTVVRYSQMLESRHREGLSAEGAEAVDFIQKGVRQMMRLVDGLLDYARIDSGGGQFSLIDPTLPLKTALEMLADILKDADADIRIATLPKVFCDEIQLTQLFQNLISNAVKYRSPQRRPRIVIAGRRLETGESEFTVTDNGLGVDPAYRDQIFVIFKRLHTHQAIPGGGIGLALCKRIVERHGGRIWVESPPEQGARFHFTIGAGPGS